MLRPALVALTVVLLLASPAAAATGDAGNDLSSPQCGTSYPSGGTFGVVGVTDGLPFSENPCLADEGSWLTGLPDRALYTNTANPGPSSTHWPAAVGRCTDPTSHTDTGCAYEYGQAAARDALSRATTTLSGMPDPRAVTWWLDVEGSRADGNPGNSWEDGQAVNAADLQGFVDALHAGGVARVGIYSTPLQWQDITGGLRIPTSPVWFAGVDTAGTARANCLQTSFTGGQRQLAQYAASPTLDGDLRCDTTAPRAVVTGPGGVTLATALRPAWSGTDDVAVTSYDVQWARASGSGGFGAWQTLLARTTARSASQSGAPLGSTTCYRVRSRDAAENVSAFSAQRCTTVPLDDRALTASAGWTRTTGATGYFAGSRTGSARLGATLTVSGVSTHRLALMATRCPTCGKVGVYVDGRGLVTVDLHSATTVRSALIPLPTSSGTSVRLRVATSGKAVVVDGLVASRV